MNTKAKNLLKNINYTVTANFLVLGISVILNLFVPKFIGIKEYSYWQLYVFYSSYVGFLHFGWLDGIYLKNGGKEYDELDRPSLGSQFWYLFLFELILSTIMISLAITFSNSSNKTIILILTASVSVIKNLCTFILYIFQSTNRIKEYAQLSRNDRYIYISLLSIYILFGGRNYFILILLDIFSRLVVSLWGFFKIKDLLLNKIVKLHIVFPEIIDNIKIGSNLMLSNIAGMLIIGISRTLIEYKWSVETFGKLSLTLSISNMFMTFINAVGVVMFPLLRRANQKNLPSLYYDFRNIFVPLSFSFLVFFQPLKIILEFWLPNYKQSLLFMGILFPMIVYEGRMSLLITTFLKTIRQEKKILYANTIALIFSIFFSIVTTILLDSLLLSIGIIMIGLVLRCIIAEKLLEQSLNLARTKDLQIELLLTIIFIFSNILLNNTNSFLIYAFFFIGYLAFVRKKSIASMKNLIKILHS
ncbi:hypothetical protein [Candidatus Enterococcus murrayae]|uniref:Uncharacterized protein n=1 Tax=Candidatus Enterococcus murrayae TaxID=2815321 RepID=A0ABS3HGF7_9ENTE|nr:hypothetical protein [Enterococcus sp. MJM16]MBO0452039.1 hypothetical protein [Enterococcus sp. MJM16]